MHVELTREEKWPDSVYSPWASISREEAIACLGAIKEEVAHCKKCPELCAKRTQTVCGKGSPTARVVFIGEAPGFHEDQLGEPFVGEAGELLTKILAALGLNRQEIFITNVLKCRPPQNRKPLPGEVAACRGYLLSELRIIRPEVVVCLGSTAVFGLLGLAQSVSSLRGKHLKLELFDPEISQGLAFATEVPVICTYHPAYLLRQPHAKKEVWADMQRLQALLSKPIKNPPKNNIEESKVPHYEA